MNTQSAYQEQSDIREITKIMQKLNNSAARDFPDLDTAALERGTKIREWGRMARSGHGLGYGLGTLSEAGPGDVDMTVELFERITNIIAQLPPRTQAVLIHLYQLSDKPVASYTAIKLGATRGGVEDMRDRGLSVIYGAICIRVKMPSNIS